MKVLALNSGSSSIKFELFDMQNRVPLASGLAERIGEAAGRQIFCLHRRDGRTDETVDETPSADHEEGVKRIASWLVSSGAIGEGKGLVAIVHRVTHGGAVLTEPTMIDESVVATIRELIPLALLHNPANLRGIEVTLDVWPEIPQVAIFDTAFHHTMPAVAHEYALPRQLVEEYHLRRYGFHGTSHKYVTTEAARFLVKSVDDVNLIVLHLGNGASATAVRDGKSIDTSMGMTPLEGLVMGTRCGDIDPGIVLHLAQTTGKSVAEVDRLLNRESGLKGLCGANDMREVLLLASEGDAQATLAVEIYAYRIKKYIGAYSAVVPNLDALVFTAGIGEHSAEIRARACADLQHLGIDIDDEKNRNGGHGPFTIHSASSDIKVLVIPTNEELEMAKQAIDCLGLNI